MLQEIAVAVDVTAPHGGWFEFRICPNNDFRVPVTHECLNRNLLPLADGTGYRVYLDIKQPAGFKNATLRLPTGLVCTQCVLQWRWHTGKSRHTHALIRTHTHTHTRAVISFYNICVFLQCNKGVCTPL